MVKIVLALSSCALVLTSAVKPDGTCGYECTSDADCGGCGTAGVCSCPDGPDVEFFQTSCSCVSAPKNAPDGATNIQDSVWPSQWSAHVDAWSYPDFGAKPVEAHGHFMYDGVVGRSRADWTPYTNGKNCKQVWLFDAQKKTSKYYVKSGPLCLYFPITDHGAGGALIGIETPDWMKRCNDAGYAHFVGREQINVDGQDEWADHWSCRLDYKAVNQSITFQNWHSIGAGNTPKGLPMRVTGGNSAPNPTKGSPRMNSVWYTDFHTGNGSFQDSDFKAPNFGIFCIPVGTSETTEFFGQDVTAHDTLSAHFHQRAHFFPHAKPSSSDLRRARQPKPGPKFARDSFRESMRVLNTALDKVNGLATKLCSDFSLTELHDTQLALFNARTPALDAVYRNASDTRLMSFTTMPALKAAHAKRTALGSMRQDLVAKIRDGACHEAVMWYVHHLTETARKEIHSHITLPRLPEEQHAEPVAEDNDAGEVHVEYKQQVSCAICHVSTAATIVV